MSLPDILRIQEEKKQKEINLYKLIYERVHNKINRQAASNSVACLYQIPKIIYGFPLIDIPKTMEYIIKILTEKGFIAFPISHNTIYISWEISNVLKKEIQKEEDKNKDKIKKEEEKREDELTKILLRTKLASRKR